MMKVLNLYAGIGGNRKLWTDVEVVAVELNPQIAKIYQDFFPQDKVIVADAHQYLLDWYGDYDFIWSSPPCPSHSRARYWGSFGENRTKVYPDMRLYEEIILLQHYCKNKWVVENVKPYYEPLIKAQECGRHLFWSNFSISRKDFPTRFTPNQGFKSLQKAYGVNLDKFNLPPDKDNRVIIRNMVEPELGLHILNESKKNVYSELFSKKEAKDG
jgi:DNA (cytosine-5)-methyltransferase 1